MADESNSMIDTIPDSIASWLNTNLSFPTLGTAGFYSLLEERLLRACGIEIPLKPVKQPLAETRPYQFSRIKENKALTAEKLIQIYDEAYTDFMRSLVFQTSKEYWQIVLERQAWQIMSALKNYLPCAQEWAQAVQMLRERALPSMMYLS